MAKNQFKLKLSGTDGNAFVLLGKFRRAAIVNGWTQEEIKPVIEKATSGSYDDLLATIGENCDIS